MTPSAFVSVVIPTLNRPSLVLRAVANALRQTYERLEVIVVVDGPDAATIETLSRLDESRLRIVPLPVNVGLAEARNSGIRAAAGDWVAFLDDDDEWHENKIEIQVAALGRDNSAINFSACRYEERNSLTIRQMPRRFPDSNENWSEYIYVHGGVLLPSTYLVEKSLMLSMPFTKGLRYNEDADWLLRARVAGAIHPVWVDAVLATYHNENEEERLSTTTPWEGRYQWLVENRALLSPAALPYYVARLCLPYARRSRSRFSACALLLREALRYGRLSLRSVCYLGAALFTRPEWRRRLRSRMDLNGR
jgi:glycosyltransferase involved in cell wall biosynthesis